MSEGIAAAIGAVAGALATMGSQGWLAWLGRRNASRTAARLLFGDAKEARDIMVRALAAGEWRTRRDFAHVVQSWRLHREAVARAIGTRAFHDVAGAFQAIEFVQLARETNAQMPDQGFAIGHDRMIDAVPRIDAARLVLARAGATWWERHGPWRPKIEAEHFVELAGARGQQGPREAETADSASGDHPA